MRLLSCTASVKSALRATCGLVQKAFSSSKVLKVALAIFGALAERVVGRLWQSRTVKKIGSDDIVESLLPSGERVISMRPVKSGPSNESRRVQTDKEVYLFQKKQDPFTFSEQRESVLRLASETGLSPKLIALDREENTVLSQWVDGAPWPAYKEDARPYIDSMKLLRLFHTRMRPLVASFAPNHAPFTYIQNQGHRSLTTGNYPPELQTALDRIDRIFQALAQNTPLTLCHGDLHKDNIVLSKEANGEKEYRLVPKLIDFDNCAVGDGLFDVAKFSLREPQETKMALLEAYLEHPPSGQEQAHFQLIDLALVMVVAVNRMRLAETAEGSGMTREEMDAFMQSDESRESFFSVPFSDTSKRARESAALLALAEFLRRSEEKGLAPLLNAL